MTVRVYLPTTTARLADDVAAGEFTVPDEAEAVVAEGDDEESEYAALMTAADLSTALATAAGVAGLRRVVLVVETAVAPAPGEVVPVRDVVAVHLDAEDRDADADPDDDLAWFTPEELPHLV